MSASASLEDEIPEHPEDWERHHIFRLAVRSVVEDGLLSKEAAEDLTDPISADSDPNDQSEMWEEGSFISFFTKTLTMHELTRRNSAAWHRIEQLFEGKIYFLPNPN